MAMDIFTTMGTAFEAAIGSFVSTTSSNIISIISPWVLLGVTIYFLITGYMVMAGRISEPLSDIMIKGAKIAFIAMVGLSTGDFMNYVANGFNGLEKDLLGAVGGKDATSIYAVLDSSADKSWDQVANIFKLMGDMSFMTQAGDMLMLLFSGVIGIIGLIAIGCISAGIVMLAKMALIVVLGFGPLFICCLMFPVTAGMFNSWLSQVLNYVFTTVIAAAFIIIFMNVYVRIVSGIATLIAAGSDTEGASSGILAYTVLMLVVAVVSSYVTLQTPSIASGLVGGVSVASASLTQMMGGAGRQAAGAVGAAKSIGRSVGGTAFGTANVASRGAAERGASALSKNVSSRYAQYMRRDGSNSISN